MKVLLSLVLLASAGFAQGHVLVVDAAGGGAYLQIGTALQNAAPGDVLLVKSGSYAPFAIANQSVAVVAENNANVQVNGTLQVRNLVAGRTVILHRLRAFGATGISPNDGPGITLKDDVGPVRLQECLMQGSGGFPGLRIERSGDVALSSAQSSGGITWEFSGVGVLASGSAVALYDCDVIGGTGAPAWSLMPPGCRGGTGGTALLSTTSGFIFCGGTLLRGGSGQDGLDNCYGGSYAWDCAYGGDGGSGIDLLLGVQTLWQLGNVIQPGSGGSGGYGSCGCGLTVHCRCDSGTSGASLASGPADSLVTLAGVSPTLALSANPARENTTVGISVHSAPGDAVLLVACSALAFTPEPSQGVRLVDWNGPHFTRWLGTTDAQGLLQSSWNIPDLGPTVESQVVHLQLLVKHTNGQRVWSNPISMVLLDSAF